MRHSTLRWGLLWLLIMTSTGCFKPWQIQLQIRPNPYGPQARFFLLPIRYSRLQVGDTNEAEFLSKKAPKDQRNWDIIKKDILRLFEQEFMRGTDNIPIGTRGQPHPRDYVIVPTISFMRPGFYAFISQPSEIEMRIRIIQGREVLDDIVLRSSTSPTGATYFINGSARVYAGGNTQSLIPLKASVASRLRTDAFYLGRWAASYLQNRLAQK